VTQDLRYALRRLRQAPGFSAAAVITLALGIAANTSVFGLLNGALIRPVRTEDPGRMVWVAGRGPWGWRGLSYPEYRAYRGLDSVFTGVIAWDQAPLAVGSGGEPVRVTGLLVSGNFFAVAGVRMALGRGFSPEEDGARGAHPVVVLSHAFWRSRFGSDSTIVGRAITVNARPFTVVGVAPRGFAGFEEPPALYAPLAMLPALTGNSGQLDEPRGSWLRAAARLRPGVAVPAAAAALQLAAERFVAATDTSLAGRSATAVPMRGVIDPHNREEALPVLLLLMAVPLLVLLVGCATVANRPLRRAPARRREVGVRRALGATRGRLVRQLLVESVVLALLGGGAGLLLSMWLSQAIVALSGAPDFLVDLAAPDARVIAFTASISLLAGVVFGLAPAFGATRLDVVTVLKDEIGTAPRGRSRMAGAFVMAQVAASLVLLVVSGLFLRSLRKAAAVDVGFETRGRVAASFDLGLLGYDGAHRDAFYRRLLDRVHSLPDVRSAALTTNLPLSGRLYSAPILAAEPGATASPVDGAMTWTWPGYLGTMGVTLLAGRDFALTDDSLATKVVIVNQTMARRLWRGRDPLGRHLRVGQDGPPLEVVGVARDGKYDALTEDAMPFLYIPMRQAADADSRATVLVHADGPPQRTIGALRALLGELDHDLPVYDAGTLAEHVAARLDVERATSMLLGVFGGVALLLATLGLYAVMAYTVARRTREMGIRMALGAARRDVLGLIVRDGMRLAGVGIVIGLALAAGLTRIVRRFLYGVTPTDALTFAAVAALLTGVAILASWAPARRATRVDPVIALRAE